MARPVLFGRLNGMEPSGPVDPVGYRRCEVLKATDQIELDTDGQILGRIAISALLP